MRRKLEAKLEAERLAELSIKKDGNNDSSLSLEKKKNVKHNEELQRKTFYEKYSKIYKKEVLARYEHYAGQYEPQVVQPYFNDDYIKEVIGKEHFKFSRDKTPDGLYMEPLNKAYFNSKKNNDYYKEGFLKGRVWLNNTFDKRGGC